MKADGTLVVRGIGPNGDIEFQFELKNGKSVPSSSTLSQSPLSDNTSQMEHSNSELELEESQDKIKWKQLDDD